MTYLDSVVEGLSVELGDDAHIRVNVAHARNLLAASSLDEQALVGLVFRARSLLRERERAPGPGLRRRGAYFFAILRDLLPDHPLDVPTSPAMDPGQPLENGQEAGAARSDGSNDGNESDRRTLAQSRRADAMSTSRSDTNSFESLHSILLHRKHSLS
jgi:hypothetical protein